MYLVMIGGSDGGISAACGPATRPRAEVSVVVAETYPNFPICGILYGSSGEVTHWRILAPRTVRRSEATTMDLRLDISVPGDT